MLKYKLKSLESECLIPEDKTNAGAMLMLKHVTTLIAELPMLVTDSPETKYVREPRIEWTILVYTSRCTKIGQYSLRGGI
jgi:hypothetical protein